MDDFILANVKGVYMTNTVHGPTPVVIISSEDEEIMPIYVGMAEGVSIHSALNNEVTQRPMTHDLMMTIIERLGSTITCVQIDEINDGIYYARLTLLYDGSSIDIDARPSDCISLAVRRDVPIKVRRSVFESSTISEDDLDGSISIDSFL
jgi:bifunctional DNase/RNase